MRERCPVKHTCNDIDNAIYNSKNISDCTKELEVQLENLRSKNMELREWGEEMARERDEFEEERNDYKRKYEDLFDEFKQLEKELEYA